MQLLLGNEPAKQLAMRANQTRRYYHAYLILGEAGMGKKTFATWFAKGMLCERPSPPCGECPSCVKMSHQTHPDFSVILPPEGKEWMPIETIRTLRQSCVIKPNEGAYRIYLIPEIQQFTHGAMAAFLKTLEEPPSHVIFLLTAPSAGRLPDTIVSRLMAVRLSPLSDEMISEALLQQLPTLDPQSEGYRYAISLSNGRLGEALRLAQEGLSQQEGEQSRHLSLATAWVTALSQHNGYALLRACASYEKDKGGLTIWLEAVLSLLRQQLREAVQRSPGGQNGIPTAAQYMTWITLVEECQDRLSANANRVLLLHDLCRQAMSEAMTTTGNR